MKGPELQKLAKDTVWAIDPDLRERSSVFRAAVITIALLQFPARTPSNLIACRLGYPFREVRRVIRRLHNNGIWCDGVLSCEWDNEDSGDVAFLLDALVGAGQLVRQGTVGSLRYRAPTRVARR
jgi:hypothetical protein